MAVRVTTEIYILLSIYYVLGTVLKAFCELPCLPFATVSGGIITPLMQMRKLRFREVESLSQAQAAGEPPRWTET